MRLAIVALLTACSPSYEVRHLTAAESRPGKTGYAVSAFSRAQTMSKVVITHTAAAAMSPPQSPGIARDIVWRAANNGHVLELCRPTVSDGHQCQVVPTHSNAPGDSIIFVDPKNLGRLNWIASSGDYIYSAGWVYTSAARDIETTPHYGVWILTGRVLNHCRIRDNTPECLQAPMPKAAEDLWVLAGYEAISGHVVHNGADVNDVLWMKGVGGALGFLRCEGSGARAPVCVEAKITQ